MLLRLFLLAIIMLSTVSLRTHQLCMAILMPLKHSGRLALSPSTSRTTSLDAGRWTAQEEQRSKKARHMYVPRFTMSLTRLYSTRAGTDATSVQEAQQPPLSCARQHERDVNRIEQHKFSVAPMMEYTDRYQRYFMRLMSKESVLYTEMVGTSALVHSEERQRLLGADFIEEEPLVLQLGGADPEYMKKAVSLASGYGYSQFNINCGCPSERVSAGCFGAALMLEPELVGRLSNAVYEASGTVASIKCRIGVNDVDSYENLVEFIETVHRIGGVKHFVIHARKAILNKNFSPHDNRNIPPLKYNFVYDLVRDFPHLSFSLNGGVKTYEDVALHLSKGVVGVMVGRGVIEEPFYWNEIDSRVYGKKKDEPLTMRRSILESYVAYADRIERLEGRKARRALLKPILNLFSGQKNGRRFRNLTDTYIRDENRSVGSGVILAASECLSADVLDSPSGSGGGGSFDDAGLLNKSPVLHASGS